MFFRFSSNNSVLTPAAEMAQVDKTLCALIAVVGVYLMLFHKNPCVKGVGFLLMIIGIVTGASVDDVPVGFYSDGAGAAAP